MSDVASATGAAGSSSGSSEANQNQTSAGEQSQDGSSFNSKREATGTGTERQPNRERSDSSSKNRAAGDDKPGSQRNASDRSQPDAKAKPASPPSNSSEKHTVRVDGKEQQVTIDELKRGYSHATAAASRMKETAEFKKTAEPVVKAIEAFKKGDATAFVDLVGLEAAEEFSEALLRQRLDYESLSPQERKTLELEHKLKGYENEKTENEKKAAAERRAKLEADAIEEIDREVGEVLEKLGRKATPRMVARAVEIMLAQLEQSKGKQRLPAVDAWKRVREDMSYEIPEYLEGMPTEELVKVLPSKVLAALEQHFIAQARSANPFGSSRVAMGDTDDEPNPKASPVRRGTKDWFEERERKLGGR